MKVPGRPVIVGILALALSATSVIHAQDAPLASVTATPAIDKLFADAVAKESAVRKALATPNPAAIASCPMDRWLVPLIKFCRKRSKARFSQSRIST